MQFWDTLANVIGNLIVLAAALTDLAAARANARKSLPRRRSRPTKK